MRREKKLTSLGLWGPSSTSISGKGAGAPSRHGKKIDAEDLVTGVARSLSTIQRKRGVADLFEQSMSGKGNRWSPNPQSENYESTFFASEKERVGKTPVLRYRRNRGAGLRTSSMRDHGKTAGRH